MPVIFALDHTSNKIEKGFKGPPTVFFQNENDSEELHVVIYILVVSEENNII